MAFCIRCGSELKSDDVFCANCGTAVADAPWNPTAAGQGAPTWTAPAQNKNHPGSGIFIIAGAVIALALLVFLVISFQSNDREGTLREPAEYYPSYTEQEIVTPPEEYQPVQQAPQPSTPATPAPTSEYLLPQSNSRKLVSEDLAHLTHEELCFARNEIYARHGWIFSIREIADFFAKKSWYRGTTLPADFDNRVLSDIEQYNIQVIMDYEAYYYGGSYY